MTPTTHDVIQISAGEYERRWAAVLAELPAYGVDAIAVTSMQPMVWLTGTSGASSWASPVILAPGQPPAFVVRRYDEDRVRAQSRIPRIVSYFGDDAVGVWAETLREMGLARARLGLELDGSGLTPVDVELLRAYLPDLQLVDVSRLVMSLMEVKSDEEIALMRRVARLNRTGLDAFVAALRDGATGVDVYLAMLRALVDAGSELPHIELLLGGSTALPHGRFVAGERLRAGEPAFTEFSSALSGYSTGLVRTALRGRNAEVEALYAAAQEALDAIGATLRPGVTTGEVDAAARSVVERHGFGHTFRHRTGYAINILWGLLGAARGVTSLAPGGTEVIRAGMTFHTPINLFERGRFGVGCSETWVVTADGCEVLSGLPRELVRV